MVIPQFSPSRVSIDRAEVNNVGFGADLVVVPETGVYRTANGERVVQLLAGARITKAEALALGITESQVVAGEPIEGSAIEGEKIARNLAAAGYSLSRSTSVDVNIDPAINTGVAGSGLLSTVKQAEQVADNQAAADEAAAGQRTLAAEEARQWYRDRLAKAESAGEPAPPAPYEGETEAAYTERIASEPVRTNENAPNETKEEPPAEPA